MSKVSAEPDQITLRSLSNRIGGLFRLVVGVAIAVTLTLGCLVAFYFVRETDAENLRVERERTAEEDRIDRQRYVCTVIDKSFESYTNKIIHAVETGGGTPNPVAVASLLSDVKNLVNECLEAE